MAPETRNEQPPDDVQELLQGFVLNDAEMGHLFSCFPKAISSYEQFLGPKQLGSDIWTEASRVAAGVEGVWSRDKFLAQVSPHPVVPAHATYWP